jgi:DNA-3-methyladenine glycosylase I
VGGVGGLRLDGAMSGPVIGEDGVPRCPWGSGPGVMRDYHDTEWGTRVHGESAYFERLTLEAFQSGLSWLTILRKREAFRAAFASFDPAVVAGFDERDTERLMADASIVRNRAKIEAAIVNARAVVALHDAGESLSDLVWRHRPADQPVAATAGELPAGHTAESRALSRELKRRGFAFVGPTTAYSTMQACGVVNDHLAGCCVRAAVEVERASAIQSFVG